MLEPVGFWSYTRHDDAHSGGQLSQLRVIVGQAIGLQYGAEVLLWQDVTAIPFGADWSQSIDETLGKTTIFMPIVTPRYLKSPNCRDEYVAFRRRMEALGRNDLVFPIHYVSVVGTRAEDVLFGDNLDALLRHQWIDFRPLFYADPTSPEVRRWAGELASSILMSLRRPASPRRATDPADLPPSSSSEGSTSARTRLDAPTGEMATPANEGRPVPTASLSAAAGVPATTINRSLRNGVLLAVAAALGAAIMVGVVVMRHPALSVVAPAPVASSVPVAPVAAPAIPTGPPVTDLERTEKAAAAGNGAAMTALGVLYATGRSVTRDYGAARAWWEKGAAAGDPEALGNLGKLYALGQGVPRDLAKALELDEKGAALGDGGAMANLGFLYEKGTGVPQDYAKARAWDEKAMAAGDSGGTRHLGYLYEMGLGVPQDYGEARRLYERAAGLNDVTAIRSLAYFYELGRGVPRDYVKARALYEKAAAAANFAAVAKLGLFYANGLGGPQDYTKARELFETAAAAGETSAMVGLSNLYYFGHGVPQDSAKSIEWSEKAATGGNLGAVNHLALVYTKGLGVAMDEVAARRWWEKSAALGDPFGMRSLGNLYYNGQGGLARDHALARDWWEKAAARGERGAMRNLADLYERGDGVPKDAAKAAEWRARAAGNPNP